MYIQKSSFNKMHMVLRWISVKLASLNTLILKKKNVCKIKHSF